MANNETPMNLMGNATFNPLDHPVCLDYPLWLERTAWAEHIPFAMFLVSAARPATIVELGAYGGVSYCAFCQAVKSLGLATKCYAVDTWEGDAHAGEINDSVLLRLRAHHDPLYGDFSTLIRSTFTNALAHFPDGAIDLLHIDGFHTYEAVRGDFENWLPKMSGRGIMLFHDINERRDDFGVWQFWEEVRAIYPSFEFTHGHGLGVLAIGDEIPTGLHGIFESTEPQISIFRKFFHSLGSRIEATRSLHDQQEYIEVLKTYEKVVSGSRVMRAFRSINEKGFTKAIRDRTK